MVIVRLFPTQLGDKGEEIQFPRATDWAVDDSSALPILCITRPATATCSTCSTCGSSEEIVASIPWQHVQMVYQHDALKASV